MIVVADTSPLNYLVQIRAEQLIESLFARVYVVPEVIAELLDDGAPVLVREWATHVPGWVTVVPAPEKYLPELSVLDKGERAALTLADSLRPATVLIDESKARRVAQQSMKLKVVGTLGVLTAAHQKGLADGIVLYRRLRESTNFRYNEALTQSFLRSLELRAR